MAALKQLKQQAQSTWFPNSGYSLEEVAKNITQKHWFQIYHYDKEATKDLMLRAQNSGYNAICLTVDGVRTDRRERDKRNNLITNCIYLNGI